jgi:hypothetical protein
MNKIAIVTLVAALGGVFLAPSTARAGGNETAAAIGGFIGGLIVGSALDNDHDHHGRFDNHGTVPVRRRVVIRGGHRHHDHGRWEWTRVRVWVPGHWVFRHDDRGRRVRYFERGHHEFRRQRVWVATGRRGHCDVCG